MSLRIEQTPLERLYVLLSDPFKDERGSFMRAFCAEGLSSILGEKTLSQINLSTTRYKGTVRGMHYQLPPHAETKIVRCIKGSIFDVAIDVREGSKTFLQWFGITLTAENKKALLIPEGFAHGFQALEDETETLYCNTAPYAREYEKSVHHADPLVDIAWPHPTTHVSEKDSGALKLEEGFKGIRL